MERMEFDQGVVELRPPSAASESASEKVGSPADILGDFPVKTMLRTGEIVS